MKKILIRLSILLAFIFSGHSALQAQFLKDLLNSVKSTAENRVNSKASQTTNKSLDKVDSGLSLNKNTAANNSSTDLESTNTVLGAFANAAAANPNDTSSADLTMKALGMMAGGSPKSHEDSLNAINNYKTANGGPGIHYEYSMIMSGNKQAPAKDTSQLYFTYAGEGRMEMRIPIPGVKLNKMIILGRVNARRYALGLYQESKTFSLIVIDTNLMSHSGENYQITKIGAESVQGYTCTHAKIISTGKSIRFSTSTTMDVWMSVGVPGSSLYMKMTNLQSSQASMMQALENAGCGGVMVKMEVEGKEYKLTELLVKANEEKLSADLFRIPRGYSESDQNMIFHMIPSSAKK
ncbi:MAG TPA: DUF4412 domain-containing protein [Chitinophagaceae bacterium]|jgi:hypothetical protein